MVLLLSIAVFLSIFVGVGSEGNSYHSLSIWMRDFNTFKNSTIIFLFIEQIQSVLIKYYYYWGLLLRANHTPSQYTLLLFGSRRN